MYQTYKECIKMNRKIITIFTIAVIVAISMGSVSMFMQSDSLTKTDSKYFTNPDYNESIFAQYPTINPTEIKKMAYTVFSGKILDISTESVLMAPIDPEIVDREGNIIEPRMDITTFTLQIDKKGKGAGIGRTIEVQTAIPSKINFEIDDEVIVMANKNKNIYELTSGPHGMYKLIDKEAIGHEYTIPKTVLLD